MISAAARKLYRLHKERVVGKCSCVACSAVRKDAREKRKAKIKAVPLLQRRAEAAEALLDKWQRKLQLAAKQVGKYSKRVRYYQKKQLEEAVAKQAVKVSRHISLEDD